jgi:hypothetical protein
MTETDTSGYAAETRSGASDTGTAPGAPPVERGVCLSCGHPPGLPGPTGHDLDPAAMRALVDQVAARLLYRYPDLRRAAPERAADSEVRGENTARRTGSATGGLRTDATLLADAGRGRARQASAAETPLANALALLNEDGDVSAAYRMLLRAAGGVHDEGVGQVGAEEILWSLVAACQLSAQPEHRKSLESYIDDAGALFTPSVRTAVRVVLDPAAAPGWLRGQIESLDGRAAPAEIVRIAGVSAFFGNLSDSRHALRSIACTDPVGRFGVPGVQASILLAFEAYQTGQWDEADRLPALERVEDRASRPGRGDGAAGLGAGAADRRQVGRGATDLPLTFEESAMQQCAF